MSHSPCGGGLISPYTVVGYMGGQRGAFLDLCSMQNGYKILTFSILKLVT